MVQYPEFSFLGGLNAKVNFHAGDLAPNLEVTEERCEHYTKILKSQRYWGWHLARKLSLYVHSGFGGLLVYRKSDGLLRGSGDTTALHSAACSLH